MPKTAAQTEPDPRWARVAARDATADGAFVYAVRTTGVYCRPSCPSRRADPGNVAFYDTAADALAAGYRACRRCDPDGVPAAEAEAALVAEARLRIEAAEQPPTLEELARDLGLSPRHLHRRFKAATGLTPRQWADAHRARRLRQGLDDPKTRVTDALHDAGFGSSSRFYEQSGARLGMTPTAYRKGGADEAIRFAVGQCALGALLVAQSRRGVCAIALGDDPETLVRELQDRFPRAEMTGDDPAFNTLVAQAAALVEAPGTGLSLPLDMRGTAFQERVWQALRRIPPGRTVSYAELARLIGEPRAVRAVAGACGANRIAVAVPCHRVVRTDGALSGYRWGVARKRALLEREAAQAEGAADVSPARPPG